MKSFHLTHDPIEKSLQTDLLTIIKSLHQYCEEFVKHYPLFDTLYKYVAPFLESNFSQFPKRKAQEFFASFKNALKTDTIPNAADHKLFLSFLDIYEQLILQFFYLEKLDSPRKKSRAFIEEINPLIESYTKLKGEIKNSLNFFIGVGNKLDEFEEVVLKTNDAVTNKTHYLIENYKRQLSAQTKEFQDYFGLKMMEIEKETKELISNKNTPALARWLENSRENKLLDLPCFSEKASLLPPDSFPLFFSEIELIKNFIGDNQKNIQNISCEIKKLIAEMNDKITKFLKKIDSPILVATRINSVSASCHILEEAVRQFTATTTQWEKSLSMLDYYYTYAKIFPSKMNTPLQSFLSKYKNSIADLIADPTQQSRLLQEQKTTLDHYQELIRKLEAAEKELTETINMIILPGVSTFDEQSEFAIKTLVGNTQLALKPIYNQAVSDLNEIKTQCTSQYEKFLQSMIDVLDELKKPKISLHNLFSNPKTKSSGLGKKEPPSPTPSPYAHG